MGHRLEDLAEALGGTLEGAGDVLIDGVGRPEAPRAGEVVVWAADKPVPSGYPASAVVALPGTACCGLPVIRVESTRLALARLLEILHPEPVPQPGVHPSAVVHPETEMGEGVHIGPHAVVGRAAIGRNSIIGAGCIIDDGVRVGSDCRLFPHVTLIEGTTIGDRVRIHAGAVLGADGFGYEPGPAGLTKIPQRGGVMVGDDVEIGALATIDRSTLPGTVTRIGAGTKIDNLVQIAHNVEVGRCCFICALTGVAGSVRVGDGVVLAGQVGVRDHVTIGDGAQVGGCAAVYGNVPAGAAYAGVPARPHREHLRVEASLSRLPELLKTVKALEKRVAELESRG